MHDRTCELEQANKHVMRVNAAQLEHFACMSHEIRTPLNCIIGLASLLQRSELTPAQDESIRMIVTSGDLLLTVVNDVLDYSKLESGKVEIDMKERNLQENLNAITHSIEMKARMKNISIDRRYGMNLPEMVKTDSRRLQQILFNLLGNAVKFSKEGGVIELHVTVHPRRVWQTRGNETEDTLNYPRIIADMEEVNETQDPKDALEEQPHYPNNAAEEIAPQIPVYRRSSSGIIEKKEATSTGGPSKCPFHKPVSSFKNTESETATLSAASEELAPSSALSENILHFVVKDYGKGIEKDDFDQIFKPFSQLNAEPDPLYGGTGLGLSITTNLVHALGGEIFVDSQIGEWTSFTVDLPLMNEPTDTSMFTEKLKETTTILVEDKTETVNRMKYIFQEFKVKLVAFASLADLEAWIKSQGPLLQNRSCALLIKEDFYDSELYYELLADFPSKAILTYGPSFKGKKDHCHFRCLLDVFPSVLMRKICECVKQSKVHELGEVQRNSSNTSHVPFNAFRVLVAEDNGINQKLLCRMLTRLGIENICVVDNGQKAVEKEASEQFDVVLMDMQMPVMGGIEACKLITSRKEGHPTAAVVFVTAHVSSAFEEECLKAGAIHYLPKPFNVGEIEKLFEKLRLIG